nr:reverse transcriptase domain-containing protein [Tanacetum cinerariifolium]
SMATTRNVAPPGAIGSGLTISIHHCKKGHTDVIDVIYCFGFLDPTRSVTPFVRWMEDYPLPDGLKVPSHVGSYDEKGDLDNFLHLFEGAIRMLKWLMHVVCHMFTYTLKDSARIWWNSKKACSILDYEYLKAKF